MSNTKSKIEWPNTLSGTLRMAVRDCLAYDKLVKRGEANWLMEVWLEPTESRLTPEPPCNACMAGAVLYQAGYSSSREIDEFKERSIMEAIDSMRMGYFYSAYLYWYFDGEATDGVLDSIRDPLDRLGIEFSKDPSFSGDNPSEYLPFERYLYYADKLAELGH